MKLNDRKNISFRFWFCRCSVRMFSSTLLIHFLTIVMFVSRPTSQLPADVSNLGSWLLNSIGWNSSQPTETTAPSTSIGSDDMYQDLLNELVSLYINSNETSSADTIGTDDSMGSYTEEDVKKVLKFLEREKINLEASVNSQQESSDFKWFDLLLPLVNELFSPSSLNLNENHKSVTKEYESENNSFLDEILSYFLPNNDSSASSTVFPSNQDHSYNEQLNSNSISLENMVEKIQDFILRNFAQYYDSTQNATDDNSSLSNQIEGSQITNRTNQSANWLKYFYSKQENLERIKNKIANFIIWVSGLNKGPNMKHADQEIDQILHLITKTPTKEKDKNGFNIFSLFGTRTNFFSQIKQEIKSILSRQFSSLSSPEKIDTGSKFKPLPSKFMTLNEDQMIHLFKQKGKGYEYINDSVTNTDVFQKIKEELVSDHANGPEGIISIHLLGNEPQPKENLYRIPSGPAEYHFYQHSNYPNEADKLRKPFYEVGGTNLENLNLHEILMKTPYGNSYLSNPEIHYVHIPPENTILQDNKAHYPPPVLQSIPTYHPPPSPNVYNLHSYHSYEPQGPGILDPAWTFPYLEEDRSKLHFDFLFDGNFLSKFKFLKKKKDFQYRPFYGDPTVFVPV